MSALSFCLRDSAVWPCTFGTHLRDSPELLRSQFLLILRISTGTNFYIISLFAYYFKDNNEQI